MRNSLYSYLFLQFNPRNPVITLEPRREFEYSIHRLPWILVRALQKSCNLRAKLQDCLTNDLHLDQSKSPPEAVNKPLALLMRNFSSHLPTLTSMQLNDRESPPSTPRALSVTSAPSKPSSGTTQTRTSAVTRETTSTPRCQRTPPRYRFCTHLRRRRYQRPSR